MVIILCVGFLFRNAIRRKIGDLGQARGGMMVPIVAVIIAVMFEKNPNSWLYKCQKLKLIYSQWDCYKR